MDISRLETGDTWFERNKFGEKKPKTWLSAAIRWFARIIFNHTENIVVEDDGVYLVGAVFPKVRKISIEEKLADPGIERFCIKKRHDSDTLDKEAFRKELYSFIDTPYDVPGLILHQGIQQLSMRVKLRIWIGRVGKKALNMVYCYELGAYMANKFGGHFPKFWRIHPPKYFNHPFHYTYYDSKK